MNLDADTRDQVRQRANFCCEFCGISETDAGGLLTIDHFRPTSKGGTDDLDNLIYSCVRCNQYKLDYWPTSADQPALWNPRQEPSDRHFRELDDGTLYPLTLAFDHLATHAVVKRAFVERRKQWKRPMSLSRARKNCRQLR